MVLDLTFFISSTSLEKWYYLAVSVGGAPLEVLKEYIRNQEKPSTEEGACIPISWSIGITTLNYFFSLSTKQLCPASHTCVISAWVIVLVYFVWQTLGTLLCFVMQVTITRPFPQGPPLGSLLCCNTIDLWRRWCCNGFPTLERLRFSSGPLTRSLGWPDEGGINVRFGSKNRRDRSAKLATNCSLFSNRGKRLL